MIHSSSINFLFFYLAFNFAMIFGLNVVNSRLFTSIYCEYSTSIFHCLIVLLILIQQGKSVLQSFLRHEQLT